MSEMKEITWHHPTLGSGTLKPAESSAFENTNTYDKLTVTITDSVTGIQYIFNGLNALLTLQKMVSKTLENDQKSLNQFLEKFSIAP